MASDSEKFDPYHKWLGIRPAEQPPNHYRLLGIGLFESDSDVIINAAFRQMTHVRSFQLGEHMIETQRLLNELAVAKICLLDRNEKAAYDANLRETLSRLQAVAHASLPKPSGALEPPAQRSIGSYALMGGVLGFALCVAVALFAFFPRVETPDQLAAETTRDNQQPSRPPSAQPGLPESKPLQPPAIPQPKAEASESPSSKPLPPEPEPVPDGKGPLSAAVAPFDAQQAGAFQESWAKYLHLPTVLTNSIGMQLTLVPPGEFTMGSTDADIAWCIDYMTRKYDSASHARLREVFQAEGPVRSVRIGTPFCLGVHEVTQAEYATVMGRQPSGDGRLPAEGIRWEEAVDFCNRLSSLPAEKQAHRQYRLPCEAEWEYACRAGTNECSLGYGYWYASNSPSRTAHPVGQKPANAWRLCDMLGNVPEWCANRFDGDRFSQFPGDVADANASHPLRGGGYHESSLSCRPAWRVSEAMLWGSGKGVRSGRPVGGFRVCFSCPSVPDAVYTKASSPAGSSVMMCDPVTGVCMVPVQPSPQSTGSTSERRGGTSRQSGGASDYSVVEPLEFTLHDAYGREVHASDYRGSPVLILLGACWCGGCQQDADILRGVEQKYRPRGLQIIRCTVWDNELPAWEFQKHYRLSAVPLQDPIRQFERRYNRKGWTFLMLADVEGKVVYRTNSHVDWEAVEARIESVLPRRVSVAPVERDGIAYLPAILQRSGESTRLRPCDTFPSLACADDGRVYVAFTSNRNGNQDVFLRVFDNGKWLADRPVAATSADEFDATVIVDRKKRPWVSWTSNAGGQRYNILIASCAGTSKPRPTQLTHSDDDAMHARMAVDAKGRIWATYYKWAKMGNLSRDKEVYTRYLQGDEWSREFHISPEDVPNYEDHTDPVVAPCGDSMVFAWSWDFHHPKGYSSVPAMPTIFLRKLKPDGTLERARPVSAANSDTRPVIAVGPDQRVWCAWESADARSLEKMVAFSIEDLDQPERPNTGTNISGLQANICTPCLALNAAGDATLVWAETEPQGPWSLKCASCPAAGKSWMSPKVILSTGNPRFPSTAYAKDGTLWIAFSVEKEGRRIIDVRSIPSSSRTP